MALARVEWTCAFIHKDRAGLMETMIRELDGMSTGKVNDIVS